ncbi:MAG: Uma2 family endonuclease [Desulfobulbaceae bacterium]|nr:Uma2 family endonuclease [Desulfobulbaceae bacterium]
MSLQAEKIYINPEDYLEMERKAEYKSEYFDGEIFAMSGASRKHNLITGNVLAAIHRQIRNRNCEAYASDMRVKLSPTGLYTYPDVVIVCGEPLFDDDYLDTLLNPAVIVEVLSKSTEHYDRGKKFENYRTLGSLSDYLLIAQNRVGVEHYFRQSHNQWLFSEYKDMQETISIDSVKCELAIKEVYEKVEL